MSPSPACSFVELDTRQITDDELWQYRYDANTLALKLKYRRTRGDLLDVGHYKALEFASAMLVLADAVENLTVKCAVIEDEIAGLAKENAELQDRLAALNKEAESAVYVRHNAEGKIDDLRAVLQRVDNDLDVLAEGATIETQLWCVDARNAIRKVLRVDANPHFPRQLTAEVEGEGEE